MSEVKKIVIDGMEIKAAGAMTIRQVQAAGIAVQALRGEIEGRNRAARAGRTEL